MHSATLHVGLSTIERLAAIIYTLKVRFVSDDSKVPCGCINISRYSPSSLKHYHVCVYNLIKYER